MVSLFVNVTFGTNINFSVVRAEVVVQLADRLLPTPEICGSNPVISKNIFEHRQLHCIVEKTKTN